MRVSQGLGAPLHPYASEEKRRYARKKTGPVKPSPDSAPGGERNRPLPEGEVNYLGNGPIVCPGPTM